MTRERAVIAVVGGGFTGAAFAVHFRLRHQGQARVVVFERRARLGLGLAYGTDDPAHRINVPAGRMTLYPEQPDSFLDHVRRSGIVENDPEALAGDGLVYPRRSDFGAYVAGEVEQHIRRGDIEHRRTGVAGIARSDCRWVVTGEDGSSLIADIVVLAVSHPSPGLPSALSHLEGHPKLVGDVTVPDALDAVATDDRILIVGNGLTSADVIASLHDRGHRGSILSISRRGLRSRGHGPAGQEPFGEFREPKIVRASELLRRIRAAIRQAARSGITWHAVLDAVRSQGGEIWQTLPLAERRRIVRLARPYWDVHRFRIAPQVEKRVDEAIGAGRLVVAAASLRGVVAGPAGFAIDLRHRGRGQGQSVDVDAIVVTTGPGHEAILTSQPFLRGLTEAGLLSACPTGLGLACDERAMAIGADGRPVEGLFIAGPLARGTFGELMGLPQVTEHAVFVADRAAEHLSAVTGYRGSCA